VIAYSDMVLVEDDLAEGAEAAGAEDKDPGPLRPAASLVDPLKGPLSRGKAAMWKDAAAARLRLFDFHRPLVVMSRKTKRKRTFLFETSEKLGAWSALLQERIDAATPGLQRLLGSVGSSGGTTSLYLFIYLQINNVTYLFFVLFCFLFCFFFHVEKGAGRATRRDRGKRSASPSAVPLNALFGT
jgi:hypothetical protein